MRDDPLHNADRYLANGDYVRAVFELREAGGADPEVTRRIRTALGRMRLMAAREFAAGRWSVAEGIFDAVGEHEQFLSDTERQECRNLVAEIRRCRVEGREVEALIQTAAELAVENQFAQSREVALQAMAGCNDPPLVARLRHLLRGLPHPLGRLIYGFDSALEVELFARPTDGARAEIVLNESHPQGGGFARLVFPTQGARVDFLDPPPDWGEAKELTFTAQLASRVRSSFRLSVGDLRSCWTQDVCLKDFYWNPLRLTFDRFEKHGDPDWRAVTRFSITSVTPEPTALHVDEIRLRPTAPLGRH